MSVLDNWLTKMFPARQQSCPIAKKYTRGGLQLWGQTGLLRGTNSMSDLDQRVEDMYRKDVRGAWILLAFLWIVVVFILVMSWQFIPDATVRIVSLLSALAVLVFNTASIAAMVKHYAEDKHFIYALDIKTLDAIKQAKG